MFACFRKKTEPNNLYLIIFSITQNSQWMDDHILKQLLVKVATDSQIGVIVTNSDGLTLWVNDYIQKITGYNMKAFKNKPPGAVLQGADTDLDHVAFIRQGLKSGKPFETEILNYAKDGRKFWVNLQISPVRNVRNEIEYFLGIQHEITELKEKNEQLENFNYLTTHDLVNQVGNLNNLINMLSSEGMSQKESKRLDFLKTTASRLKATIKDLRNILSYLGKRKELDLEEICLADLVEEVCESYSTHAKNEQIAIIHQIPQSLGIYSNRMYLSSVFHNLISNAIKYRDPRKKSELNIRTDQQELGLNIHFEDNGLGIDLKNNPNKVFGAFKTFHSNPEAIGIGLYLTKKQIESLKGTIAVKSQPKVGTTFTIYLPYLKQPHELI